MGDLAITLHVAHYLEQLSQGRRVPRAVDAEYPFSHVGARLREADVLLGNLECVVSTMRKPATEHTPFLAPLFTPRMLKDAGVDLVSIANNHTPDFGRDAFEDMRRRLDASGLPYLGARSYTHGPEDVFIAKVGGLRIGYLGFYLRSIEGMTSDVRRARPQVDVLVVFNHWGADNQAEVLLLQRRAGHALIDAGADVVTGTHTHVMQPEEWYRGKLIHYGLGNFVFSGQPSDPDHQTGGYLEVTVGRGTLLGRKLYRARLDAAGAPHWLDSGPVEPPPRTAQSEPPPL